MKLEQQLFGINDLENLSASALYTGHLPPMGPGGFGLSPKGDTYGNRTPIFKTPLMNSSEITIEPINLTRSTEYFKLLDNKDQTIGISHHSTGLGKLKILDKEKKIEYGIPLIDILNKPLSDWNIEKK